MILANLVCKLIRMERYRMAESLYDPSGPAPDCNHHLLELEDSYICCKNCGFLFRF